MTCPSICLYHSGQDASAYGCREDNNHTGRHVCNGNSSHTW